MSEPDQKEIYEAFVNAQAKFKNPKKNVDSESGEFKTAPLARYFDIVRKPFHYNGLAWTQFVKVQTDKVTVNTKILHKSGLSMLGEPVDVNITSDIPRELAIYIGKRDSFCAVMGIIGENDIEPMKGRNGFPSEFKTPKDRKAAKRIIVEALQQVDTPELLDQFREDHQETIDRLEMDDADYIADIQRDIRVLETEFASHKDNIKGRL